MMTKEAMDLDQDDAQLVSECLAGGRDAFGRIVERYQSLICSLAYSATGSVSQSEDLAQETFVTAWTQLPELREPAKLRSWLCGIARNLIGKALRRDVREPVHAAQPLEAAQDSPAVGLLPVEHVISEEERAILWRSLERIPEIYREPLVLFYRQHQSVERVAVALDLSEETVRQRLSRGRKLLQEQVLAFVEGALENTNPTAAFTVGVMASLPLVASTTAVASASAGTAAAKGGVTAKTATSLGAAGAVSAGVFFLFSVIGFLIFLGSCIGCLMSRAVQQSPRQAEYVVRFWRMIAIGFGAFVVFPLIFVGVFRLTPGTHMGVYEALSYWMGLSYLTVPVALAIWFWRWSRKSTESGQSSVPSRKRFYVWLSLGMLVPSFFFAVSVYEVGFHAALSSRKLTGPELQNIIAEHRDAAFSITQYRNGSKVLNVQLPEEGRVSFFAEATPKVIAQLEENHIAYKTFLEGVDYDQFGAPWRLQGMLAFFVAPIGLAALFWRPRARASAKEASALPENGNAGRWANNAFRAFASAFGLALLAGAIFLGLTTAWGARDISVNDLPKIVSDYKFARFQVWHYSDGSRVLQIFPHNVATGPFVAPATEQALSLLNQSGIPFRTIVQGRDFGYRISPGPAASLAIMIVLTVGAVFLLRLATKGTIVGTWVFGATFLAVFVVLFGLSVRDMSRFPKLYVSTARVKVAEWSKIDLSPQDEGGVVASAPVLRPVIKAVDFNNARGQRRFGKIITDPEKMVSALGAEIWVEVITNNQGGVLELSINDRNPSGAAELANAIAKSYCEYRNQGRSVAEVLDPAVPNPEPYRYPAAKLVFKGITAGLLGLVVGLVVAWIVAARRRRRSV